jgi:hypothetical protein
MILLLLIIHMKKTFLLFACNVVNDTSEQSTTGTNQLHRGYSNIRSKYLIKYR